MNNTLSKTVYKVGNIGWSGNATHIISVDLCECPKFEKGHGHREAYAMCASNTGMHYRIGPVTRVRNVAPTTENITCKKCLDAMVWMHEKGLL